MAIQSDQVKFSGSEFSTTMTLAEFIQNQEWKDGSYDVVYNMTTPVPDMSQLTGKQSLWLLTKEAFEDIGSEIYQKINNHVKNNSDIFVCRPEALKSIAKSIGMTNHNIPDLSNYPQEVLNLIEIFSIPLPRLLAYNLLNDATTSMIYDIGYERNCSVSVTNQELITGKNPMGGFIFDIIPDQQYCSSLLTCSYVSLLVEFPVEYTNCATMEVYAICSDDTYINCACAVLTASATTLTNGRKTIAFDPFIICSSACGHRVVIKNVIEPVDVLTTIIPDLSQDISTYTYERQYGLGPSPLCSISEFSTVMEVFERDYITTQVTNSSTYQMSINEFDREAGNDFISTCTLAYLNKSVVSANDVITLKVKAPSKGGQLWIQSSSAFTATFYATGTLEETTPATATLSPYADETYRYYFNPPTGSSTLSIEEDDIIEIKITFSGSIASALQFDIKMNNSSIVILSIGSTVSESSSISWLSSWNGKVIVEIGNLELDHSTVTYDLIKMDMIGLNTKLIPSGTLQINGVACSTLDAMSGGMLMQGYEEVPPEELGWSTTQYDTIVAPRRNYGVLSLNRQKFHKFIDDMFIQCLSDNLDQNGLYTGILQKIYGEHLPKDFLYEVEPDRLESEEMKLKFGIPSGFSTKEETNKVLDKITKLDDYSKAQKLLIRDEIDYRISTASKYGTNKKNYRYGEYEKERTLKKYAAFIEELNLLGDEQIESSTLSYDIISTAQMESSPYGSVFNYVQILTEGTYEVLNDPEWSSTSQSVIDGVAVKADMIENVAVKLRNLCLKIAQQRYQIRNTVLKHVMRGTQKIISTGIGDYINYEFADSERKWGYSPEISKYGIGQKTDPTALIGTCTMENLGFIGNSITVIEYDDLNKYLNQKTCGTHFWDDPAVFVPVTGVTCSDIELFHNTRELNCMSACAINDFYCTVFSSFTTNTANDLLACGIITDPIDQGYYIGCGTEVFCEMLKQYSGCATINPNFITNIINKTYPSGAPAPYLWNLAPSISRSSILSNIYVASSSFTTNLVQNIRDGKVFNKYGNTKDLWKLGNRSLSDLRSKYEYSTKFDSAYRENMNIDNDNPFNMYAMEEYLIIHKLYQTFGETVVRGMLSVFFDIWYGGIDVFISENMLNTESNEYKYVNNIINNCPKRDFRVGAYGVNLELSEQERQLIIDKLYVQMDKIVALAGSGIYQFATDRSQNRYYLFKEPDATGSITFEQTGTIWMRYGDHPIAFPLLTKDSEGNQSATSQINIENNYLVSLMTDVNDNCHDFGIFRMKSMDFIWFHCRSTSGIYITYYGSIERTSSKSFPFSITRLENNFATRTYRTGTNERYIGFYLNDSDILGSTVVHVSLQSYIKSGTAWIASIRFDTFGNDGTSSTSTVTLPVDKEWVYSDNKKYPTKSWKLSYSDDLLSLYFDIALSTDYTGRTTGDISGHAGYGNYHPEYSRIPNPSTIGKAIVEFDISPMSRPPLRPRITYHYEFSDVFYRGVLGYQGYEMEQVLDTTCTFLYPLTITDDQIFDMDSAGKLNIQFMGRSVPPTPSKIRIVDETTGADFDLYLYSTDGEELGISMPGANSIAKWENYGKSHVKDSDLITFREDSTTCTAFGFSSCSINELWLSCALCSTSLIDVPSCSTCEYWRTGDQTNAYGGMINWDTFVDIPKYEEYITMLNTPAIMIQHFNYPWNARWGNGIDNIDTTSLTCSMLSWSSMISSFNGLLTNIGDITEAYVKTSTGCIKYIFELEGLDCFKLKITRSSDTSEITDLIDLNAQPICGERFIRTVHFSQALPDYYNNKIYFSMDHDYKPEEFWPSDGGRQVYLYLNTNSAICRATGDTTKVIVAGTYDGSGMTDCMLYSYPVTISAVTPSGYAVVNFDNIPQSMKNILNCCSNSAYFTIKEKFNS